ncbi:hypothetical protein SO802_008598 [Lithocarpus litseifolius]|uniref:Uncharacterized protein n=1 Tax=Lithocarpus litseifolius TaxID=425828 RepID=A0AAW2DD90_9ROSI
MRFSPSMNELKDNEKFMDGSTIRKAVESLEVQLNRSKVLVQSPNSDTFVKHVEEVTHDLGRSLGLLLLASLEVSIDLKEKIGNLHKELMSASLESLDIGDVVLQLKYGNDEEFKYALLGLNELIGSEKVSNEWIDEEGIIPILFNRLGSSKLENRLTIIQILRRLALENADNKEKMVDVEYLSMLVKSLTQDVEERREAVGLLVNFSDPPAVRRRMGRIQGCIVVLVAMLNGDDPVASRDAGKLLNAFSSNTRNALHMAEAGYFKPLVQYLKEGSDMSKVLMATALSRMELTDKWRAALGEDGAIEPLVKMFNAGKLESKLSALSALQNLSRLTENI